MMTRRRIFLALGLVAGIIGVIAGGMERRNISYLRLLNHTAAAHAGVNYGMQQNMAGRLISSKLNSYHAQILFTTNSGQQVEGFKFLTENVYLAFQSVRPVLVYYDPRNPNNFVLQDEVTEWLAKILIGVAIAFCSIRYLRRDEESTN